MKKYQLYDRGFDLGNGIKDTETGNSFIEGASEWQKYQLWLSEGNTPEPEFTEEELAEQAANEYIRLRSEAHIPIPDQMDMQYWDAINRTTKWVDYVTELKKSIPKN